jgi:hypothetical protein
LSRELLNNVSDWVLAPVFIGASVTVAVGGWALVRRFLPGWQDAESAGTVVGVAAMLMTVFALVLAFVIVNLYSGYVSASDNVSAEASSLRTLVRDAGAFPTPERRRINLAVAGYVMEVREREFSKLRAGNPDPAARLRLSTVYAVIQDYTPATETQRTFYGTVSGELNAVADERQKRIEAAETAIPAPLLALVIVTGFVTLASTVLLKTHRVGVDMTLLVGIAVVVGVGVLTALILQYPFSGSIEVTSAPYAGVAQGL